MGEYIFIYTYMKINDEIKKEIIKLSSINKQSDIANILGLSKSTVGKLLRKNNINTHRNRLNESKLKFNINYFDNIDLPEKAYWLGFISADGCLKDNKVRLVSKDYEVIYKFKKALNSEHKIVNSIIIDKRSNKKYQSYILSITNNGFTKKVEKYINIDKSTNFYLPNIDKNLYPYFIAGMFDGDGSFTIYGKNKHRIKVSLISTKECLEQVQNFLLEIGLLKKKTKILKHYTTYRLYLYADAYKFLNYIYNEKTPEIYLDRKYEKFKKYKNDKK